MKLKLKKRLALILTATMMAGTLAGCGGNGGNTAATTGTTAGTNAGGSGQVSATQKADEAPVTLDIHFHSNNKYTLANADGELLPVFKLAAEKTNTVINNTANPVAQNSLQEFELQATEKFPADIYGGTNIRQSVNSYGMQGGFLALDELIDAYGPNIKKYLEENPEVKKSLTAADGHIYFLSYLPDGGVGRTFFIRTDWLKKLGLDMPKNFEELENILYAFKNQDPNGNGQKDEIPAFNDKWQEAIRLANLWGARVYGNDSFSERVVLDDNDKMYHAWTAEEFKTALIGLHKWYADGIIDPELFSRKANTAKQTLWTKENVAGMTHDFFASTSSYNYNEELLAAVPDFKLEAFLPVNANGEAFEEHQRVVAKNDGWGISANSKNPEAAMRYMDWFFSEEGQIASNFGIEGSSYTMVDGKPVFTEEVLSKGNVNTYLQSTYGAQLPIGYAQNFDYESQWTSKEGMDAYTLYQKQAKYVKMTPVLSFNEEEQEIFDSYLSNLNTYQDETVTAFIIGKLDIEAEWDTYVQKCKDLGEDKIVEIYQSSYERYKQVQ